MQQLTSDTPLNEWLSSLENAHFKAIDLGLERVKAVAEELDLLQPAPFVITVGGTNGKGTTCRLLESILINAGYRVGVYSSPHLIRYNERVRIQNQELSDKEHSASFAFIAHNKSQSLTYFEFSTLSALHLFKQAKLDVVILEVGLGGRLDATNIVDNDMAVITSIDIDHVAFLGDNLEQIGFEKAGIFRANRPVIIGEPNAPQSMLKHAKELGSSLFCRNLDWQFSQQTHSWNWQTLDNMKNQPKSAGKKYQDLPLCAIPLANAATVLAAVQKLPFAISEEVIRKSLQEVELTGRFQALKQAQIHGLAQNLSLKAESLPQIIIDVGHNPHAAKYLASKLAELKGQERKIRALCGILQDKDTKGVLEPLLPYVDYWYCATLTGERGQTGEQLLVTLQQVSQANHVSIQAESATSVTQGAQKALTEMAQDEILLIFGSFHTVGEFLQML